ncbi:MAG: hypothetical protein EXQ84_06945 [Rhodospirillaceae bacterium]|nr:hypothetical protein [Rhodospirillaceae bacterium]
MNCWPSGIDSGGAGPRGSLRLEARAFADAIDLSARVIARDQTNVGAWLIKTQALLLAGRGLEAEAAYGTVTGLAGRHPAGWNNLGNVFDALGRAGEARVAFARAIEQAPDFSLAHNNLGASRAGQGTLPPPRATAKPYVAIRTISRR